MLETIALATILLKPTQPLQYLPQPKPKAITIAAIAQPIEPMSTIQPIQPLSVSVQPQTPTPKESPRKRLATSSEGNSYSPGYCTWYVKNKRGNIPNGLGNAATWYSRAAAQGIPVGSTPRVGAVAWQGGGLGHVALVTAVNGDKVTISEMNYKGRYIVSSRTVLSSTFKYIY